MNRTDAPQKKPVAFGVNGQREAVGAHRLSER